MVYQAQAQYNRAASSRGPGKPVFCTILPFMETTTGPLGLSIPVPKPGAVSTVRFTPSDILQWRNNLEMADLSVTTKKLYQLLTACNQAALLAKDRLEILELLRPTVQFIVQSLSKHYTHQAHALNQEQFTIARLAETLEMGMAYGYKVILEQAGEKTASAEVRNSLAPIAIARIFYYFAQILLQGYKIYSPPPAGVWHELHLIYQYLSNNLHSREDLLNDYKRIILFAGSQPTNFRQHEQEALYRGTEIWAALASLGSKIPNTTGAGYLMIDLQSDRPPIHPSRGDLNVSEGFLVLSVQAIANRLKDLLATIEPNELGSRMSHGNQAEYAIPASVLRGLLKIWGSATPRTHERVPQQQAAQLCIGLRATHFYVNHAQPFEMPQSASRETGAAPSNGQALWATEEKTDELGTHIDFSAASSALPVESTDRYTFYPCTIVDETPMGYSIVLKEAIFSVLQAGEVIGLRKADQDQEKIEICGVRWLQYESQVLRLGVERVSMVAKAGAIQLLKNAQPVGDYVRCLILESSLLVPTMPFKSRDRVYLLESDREQPTEYALSNMVEATGGYKRFQCVHKRLPKDEAALASEMAAQESATAPKTDAPVQSTGDKQDPFDAIWSQI